MSPYLIYRTNADGEGGKGSGKVETLAIWCVPRFQVP